MKAGVLKPILLYTELLTVVQDLVHLIVHGLTSQHHPQQLICLRNVQIKELAIVHRAIVTVSLALRALPASEQFVRIRAVAMVSAPV